MKPLLLIHLAAMISMLSCQAPASSGGQATSVRLVTLDPGHFHAALVQKSMYPDVDSVVHVYAPASADLEAHLKRIEQYNTRAQDPTHWKEAVYTGNDFFEKMLADKTGNVVVLSGNNGKKAEYLLRSLAEGFHVLADKPMVIDGKDFQLLKQAFDTAATKGRLLYDIMTERYEITTMLQRELSQVPAIFGTLEKGSAGQPAITKESVHHFYKYVSGNVLTRPVWFFDVAQQGEGMVDVMTHLVDLVQWECFPDQAIDYTKDIEVDEARRWTTDLTRSQFSAITNTEQFPEFLRQHVAADSVLKVYCNGEINYRIRGVHAKTSVTWAYKAPEGGGDTHYSIMRGTKANLVIRQGAEQQYKPVLYIEPVSGNGDDYVKNLTDAFNAVQTKYPGIGLKQAATGWEVVIPEKYKEGHEAHFARVTQKFLEYLKHGNMPAWEIPGMIAKYYTTTTALELAKGAAVK